MPSVTLGLPATAGLNAVDLSNNPLPSLLQTPSGLAVLELQGTIHAPFPNSHDSEEDSDIPTLTPVGRIEFPLYKPDGDKSDSRWMKLVYLYVGKYQRLTGEIKKLPKPLAVVAKTARGDLDQSEAMDVDESQLPSRSQSELEILEIVRHKIIFSGRPEPVSG